MGFALLLAGWRAIRLRRALFALRRQLHWTLRYAPREDLVLEVGSGHNPHIRSDILCDMYLLDDVHRASAIVADRPLVIGNAEILPFKTGAFDTVIASHLVEHLGDPLSFFHEAGRVANKGLFTAPSALREKLVSDPQHRWFVSKQDDTLHFLPKQTAIHDPEIQEFVSRWFVRSLNEFDDFIMDHWDDLETEYQWHGEPQGTVDKQVGVDVFVHASTIEPTANRRYQGVERLRSVLRGLVRTIAHRFVRSSRAVSWEEILACPICRGDVLTSQAVVVCQTCGRKYPIEDGIPIMLAGHELMHGENSDLGPAFSAI